MEPVGDAPARLVQDRALSLHRPVAGQATSGSCAATPASASPDARRARARGTSRATRRSSQSAGASTPSPSTRDGSRSIAEQLLDDALGLLVAALAEVLVADDALAGRRSRAPASSCSRTPPDPVVVIDRDRVVDLHRLDRPRGRCRGRARRGTRACGRRRRAGRRPCTPPTTRGRKAACAAS